MLLDLHSHGIVGCPSSATEGTGDPDRVLSSGVAQDNAEVVMKFKKIAAAGLLGMSAALLAASVAAAAAPNEEDGKGTINVLGREISRDRVAIPTDWGEPLTKKMSVQAAYNGDDMLFRLQFPSKWPGFIHDYYVYEGGKWVHHGEEANGAEPENLYEDRIVMHVDDGSVRGFQNQGCWVTCHQDLRDPFTYAAPTADEVKQNSFYRDVIKKTDTRKYIPESRNRPGEWWDVKWNDISAQDAAYVKSLKEAGVILDAWHWRGARGAPLGYSDDTYVLEYRNADAGTSAFATNFDSATNLPKFMFDPAKAGSAAQRWDDVTNHRIPMKGAYYLGPDTLVKFDPGYKFQEGDAIPARYLQVPKGSVADITSQATWDNGLWTVTLRRKMDTGQTDDKAFKEFKSYNIAFAFYTNATGNRFHYVTFPQKLGLSEPGDVRAVRFAGKDPDWNAAPTTELTGFYPGQSSWQFITSDKHPGSPAIRGDSVACASCHTEESLAQRAVGLELRSEREAPRPWTWAGGLLGILGIGFAGILLRRS